MSYRPGITQSDCRKAGLYQLSYDKGQKQKLGTPNFPQSHLFFKFRICLKYIIYIFLKSLNGDNLEADISSDIKSHIQKTSNLLFLSISYRSTVKKNKLELKFFSDAYM